MEEQGDQPTATAPTASSAGRLALALLEPERPHNFGAALRLAACLDLELHVIEPCGFPLNDRRIRQAALDYAEHMPWRRHMSFAAFDEWRERARRRLVLLTTRAILPYVDTDFRPDDILLLGREGGGAPAAVHERADLRARIPMRPGARSLNVIAAATMVVGEAMRQTRAFDRFAPGRNFGRDKEER